MTQNILGFCNAYYRSMSQPSQEMMSLMFTVAIIYPHVVRQKCFQRSFASMWRWMSQVAKPLVLIWGCPKIYLVKRLLKVLTGWRRHQTCPSNSFFSTTKHHLTSRMLFVNTSIKLFQFESEELALFLGQLSNIHRSVTSLDQYLRNIQI